MQARRASVVAITLLSAAALTMVSSGSPRTGTGRAAAAVKPRPNVVVVETDDQTLESMRVMSNVKSLISDQGATFTHNFVNFSLCCPSRATFLTGEYAHNHRVLGNNPPRGGFQKFERLHGHDNLAVWLHRAGYHTALVGKYLNGYGNRRPRQVPPGWTEWDAGVAAGTQAVYDYDLNENGSLVHYGTDPPDFKQDVLTGRAVDFVERRAPQARPFFLWLTYTAPHVGTPDPSPQPPSDCDEAPKPAPRHAHAFDSEPLPMPPNFNEADVSDKPAFIRSLPVRDSQRIADLTRIYRCELESLLSVDEGVKQLVDALSASGELANTYVIFTSDNGYFHGEHRVATGKGKAYEESIRVPLVIRGPGIPHGVRVRDLSINADLAPTIARIAGAKPRLRMDGRPLLGAARHPTRESGRELELEEPFYTGVPRFKGIRTARYVFVRYKTGESELYDLKRDPYELRNLRGSRAYRKVKRRLARRLDRLGHCRGNACRLRPRLELELRHRKGHRQGHPCARKPIRAVVRGRDSGGAVEAEFYARGRRFAVDRRQPLARKLPDPLLQPGALTAVRVRVSMLDGRRMTIGRSVLACG